MQYEKYPRFKWSETTTTTFIIYYIQIEDFTLFDR